uniref:Uncharacterized protein n=1 Tax=Equus asinus asinus TaxID=83772 RepID=A0A8C4MJT8_EQUAS
MCQGTDNLENCQHRPQRVSELGSVSFSNPHYVDAVAEKQTLDEGFQKRLERNKIAAEEPTAEREKMHQKLKEKKLLAEKMKLEQKKQRKGSRSPVCPAIKQVTDHTLAQPYYKEAKEYSLCAQRRILMLRSQKNPN